MDQDQRITAPRIGETATPPHGGSSVQRPGQRPGAWVTLHLHFASGEEKRLVGWLVGAESGQYKLTKLVTERPANDGVVPGMERTIHDGVWLVSPAYVWMVEHEQEAPLPGFCPLAY